MTERSRPYGIAFRHAAGFARLTRHLFRVPRGVPPTEREAALHLAQVKQK
jgi:hypothetical protein